MEIKVITYDSIGSTNAEALELARRNAPEGVCVVARQQDAGRGRHGRSWASPADAGLYFSIILRPTLEPRLLPLITLMAGVAVHELLADLDVSADIKWVNDLLVGEKKIAGILAETTESDLGTAVVLGIGINVRSDAVRGDLSASATSIEAETGRELRPTELIDPLIGHIENGYRALQAGGGPARVMSQWRQRSSYYAGKQVTVRTGGEVLTGMTAGLEPNGALCLRLPDGRITVIHAGDVERLRSTASGGPA